MKIKIDTYFDVTCSHCGRSRSTDFERGMETKKTVLSKLAYREGWKCIQGNTYCPECALRKKHGDLDVGEVEYT